jgi:2-polyprenyl-3-methyl-5-hydroxy-6-metoxy-1,4-benzoquinol methylase
MDKQTSANQAHWNELVAINARSEFYSLDKFKAGGCALHNLELEELGLVAGRTLLHLQCHFGLDSLSWARLGASVTGVDFSEEGIRLARQLSQECAIPAEFIETNLYDLPERLQGQFDIVFTSYGALTWLSDLPRWARIVTHFLKPGGVFYMAEIHPFSMVFDDTTDDQPLRVGYSYFDTTAIECEVQGSYADRSAAVNQKVCYQWNYPLGQVVSALIEAGLKLEFLHEFPYTVFQQYPFLEQGQDGYFRLPGGKELVPLLFSLKGKRTDNR